MEVGAEGIMELASLITSPPPFMPLKRWYLQFKDEYPVLLDGGTRLGTDVFKALVLGAQAVMVGHPVVYGLAAKAEYGARRTIEMLKMNSSMIGSRVIIKKHFGL